MDRSEGNDDELYPAAPVPAHERQWRHPSEVGAQAWTAGEPPLTIGRGLSAATGAIGVTLALAVLWTMLPTRPGRSAVSVRSTIANALSFTTSSATFSDSGTTTGPVSTTVPAAQPEAPTKPRTTVVPAPAPQPTDAMASAGPTNSAVAVAVNNGALIITTANAVSSDNVVNLVLPDGGIEQAHVLLVDLRSGFAVLAHDPGVEMGSFTVAPTIRPGDQLTFYGTDGLTAVVQADGSVMTTSDTDTTGSIDTPDLPEGTPVVNQRGELVALCSHDDDGPVLVTLANLDQFRRALSSGGGSRVWLGVVLADDLSGALAIGALDSDGPAATAGLQIGDVIESIAGITVRDMSAIGAALAGHLPGDTVAITLHRNGIDVTIDVILGSPRSSL